MIYNMSVSDRVSSNHVTSSGICIGSSAAAAGAQPASDSSPECKLKCKSFFPSSFSTKSNPQKRKEKKDFSSMISNERQ